MHEPWRSKPASAPKPEPGTNDSAGLPQPGLLSLFTEWSERRYAAACCQALLKGHRAAVLARPELVGVELYRVIVEQHVGGDAALAESLLDGALESYASWPVSRALSFRDVVHYLAVSGYLAAHRGRRWMCSDVRAVVNASIPHGL